MGPFPDTGVITSATDEERKWKEKNIKLNTKITLIHTCTHTHNCLLFPYRVYHTILCLLNPEYPNCLQTSFALERGQLQVLGMVCQSPLQHISTRPSNCEDPSTSFTAPLTLHSTRNYNKNLVHYLSQSVLCNGKLQYKEWIT